MKTKHIKEKDLENPTIELCYNLNEEELNFLLIESIKRNNPVGVSLALEFGASTSAKMEGEIPISALRLAFKLDRPLIANLLLKEGADLFEVDSGYFTIEEALKENKTNCIPLIIKYLSHIDSVTHAGKGNLISMASYNKNKPAIDLLISLGANPDGKCTVDDSFIDYEHGAINQVILSFELTSEEKIDMIKFLISRGANMYGIFTDEIEYPYEMASVFDAKVLNWFYEIGMNLELKDREAVITASASQTTDSLELLYNLGFDLNVKNKKGRGGVFVAILSNKLQNLKFLIEKGVSYNKEEALQLATENNRTEIISYLLREKKAKSSKK